MIFYLHSIYGPIKLAGKYELLGYFIGVDSKGYYLFKHPDESSSYYMNPRHIGKNKAYELVCPD